MNTLGSSLDHTGVSSGLGLLHGLSPSQHDHSGLSLSEDGSVYLYWTKNPVGLGLGLSLALLCPQHCSPQSLAQEEPQKMLLNESVCLSPLSLPACMALAQTLNFGASVSPLHLGIL